MEQRLPLIRLLLKANPLFDKITKIESTSTLLSLDYNNTTNTNIATSNNNDKIQEDNQNNLSIRNLWICGITPSSVIVVLIRDSILSQILKL